MAKSKKIKKRKTPPSLKVSTRRGKKKIVRKKTGEKLTTEMKKRIDYFLNKIKRI